MKNILIINAHQFYEGISTGKLNNSVVDVMTCYTASYKFCGADVLPSFSCFDVMKNPDIDGDLARLKQQLAKIFV